MRFLKPVRLPAAGLAFILLLGLSACSEDKAETPTSSGNGGSVQTDAVSISNLSFSPSNITVSAGTQVTWTNLDAVAHTVTSDDGGFASSGNLAQNDTYSVTFSNPGAYPYHCAIHPAMTGTVNVTQ